VNDPFTTPVCPRSTRDTFSHAHQQEFGVKIFIDTAHVEEIREAQRLGVIDGVTTNPTHVSKTGRPYREVYEEICAMIKGPVSLECVALDADGIYKEAKSLVKIGDNVVIKVPLMKEGLVAVKRLSSEGIKTNVTVNFSPLQALLAAKVGATYISPFVGRLDAIGHVGMDLVRQIRQIFDNYGYETEVLAAAIRHPLHVLEAALAGADICTMALPIIQQMYEHPLTDAAIQMFLSDWSKVPQNK
jgi:transaldolase